MRQSPADVKSWFQDRFHPVVLVSATPAAENICQTKNGLSIIDILRPYASLQQLNAPLRVGETSMRVQDLKLRFTSCTAAHQPKPEVIDDYLKEVLQTAAAKHAKAEPFDNLLQSIQSGTAPNLTPWYAEYREEFIRLLSFGEHETIDHPVACIYIIPSDVDLPLKHVEALIQQTPLPALMEKEVMLPVKDPQFPKHYVLLHDGYVGGEEAWKKAQDNLKTFDVAFGANHCTLLRINTGKGEQGSAATPGDFFKSFRRPPLPGGGAGEPETYPADPPHGVGMFLTTADVEMVAQFVYDFAGKTLLPRLEDRINRLNNAITATRRGIRNRLTRLWTGRAEGASNDSAYPHHTIESQMRQLGDLAFLLKQYEFASSMYRLAAADYLAQHNYKWYAGAEEMIGLCTALDPSMEGSDPAKYFTRGYDNYIKVPGRLHRMLATRSMILSAAYQMSAGRFLGANLVLMRAHYEEENARAALLLEQGAYALLHLKQPSIRKFAFFMVLAGLRFHSCQQKRLSVNAYRQVLGIYQGRQWQYIEEHLNDLLGKMLREFGDSVQSTNHFFSLLNCTYRSPQLQQHYVNQFLEALKALDPARQSALDVANLLHLPTINRGEVGVAFNDQRCCSNGIAAAVPEETWTQLEAVCAPQDMPTANWLNSTAKQSIDHEEFNTCVAGEDILVDVEFRNPLQIKLKVSEVSLEAEFSPMDPAHRSAPPEDSTPSTSSSRRTQDLSDQVLLSCDSFTLHPGETLVEQLKVKPLQPGWLRITGVRWMLNDAMPGQATFDIKGRRRKRPKGTRPSQTKHYPPNKRLLFSVIPPLPRVEVTAPAMPTTLYQGEMVKVSMTVHNVGSEEVRNVQLVLDSPHVAARLCERSEPPEQMEASSSGRESVSLDASSVLSLSGGGQAFLYQQAAALVVEADGKLRWEVWLNPQKLGHTDLRMIWYYEPQGPPGEPPPQMKYRTLRMCFSLEVVPLLLLTHATIPSSKDLYRYLLRLDIAGAKDGDVVQVKQLSCSSGGEDLGWRLSHLNRPTVADDTERTCYHSVSPAISVSPGEASSLFYNLSPPVCKQAHDEETAPPSMPWDPFSGAINYFHRADTSQAPPGPLTPSPSASSLASPSSPSDPPVDFMLMWHIPSSKQPNTASPTRFGVCYVHHCMTGQAKAPLRLMLKGQATVQHNFRKQSMCVIPLDLSVRNCSSSPVEVVAEVGTGWTPPSPQHAWCAAPPTPSLLHHSPPSSIPSTPTASAPIAAGNFDAPQPATASGPPVLAGLPPSNDYMWCGRVRFTSPPVPPGEIWQVPLRLSVFRPGTYLVSDYRCTIQPKPTLQEGTGGSGKVSLPVECKGEAYLIKVEASAS